MCLNKLFKKFKKSGPTTPATPTTPFSPPAPDLPPSQPATLPHPEEPMDPSQTAVNTPISVVFQKWYDNWLVPAEQRDYWKTAIDVQVYDAYPPSLGFNPGTPAVSWEGGGKRHLACLAPWFNPGVTAHEQAHNSYSLLTGQQRTNFANDYKAIRNSEPLMILMFQQHSYASTNDVEAHAEIYRYIGEKMPGVLKQYYPRLF